MFVLELDGESVNETKRACEHKQTNKTTGSSGSSNNFADVVFGELDCNSRDQFKLRAWPQTSREATATV